ncbi:hypothetical protein [Thermogemmatispora tikiterensis]|uniref:Uncharacterized protein n=1 Tax=Thermogemmatispora tikiterensis TaxID=1825093 RepID=A0A328VNE1_9CHLR|nr:hypothetical protein [Thermogemmatispora tikiterensis]RAQ96644.1 hypothetical protein A4R35_13960 [Thermogemmatispora tikiterensis]
MTKQHLRYRISNRTALSLLGGLALPVWAAFLLFTYFVPPQGLLAFVAFFVLLLGALICTFAPLAYLCGLLFISSRLYRATIRHALRQGTLLALCIVLNLILRALHSWSIVAALAIVAAAVLVEILSLAKKW